MLAGCIATHVRHGHAWLAVVQLALGLLVLRGVARDLLLAGGDAPVWLGREEGGWLVVGLHSGRQRRVRPAPATLVWGRSLLLVLEGENGPRIRLLLGPGNVPASQLAALRREWLRPRPGLAGPLA